MLAVAAVAALMGFCVVPIVKVLEFPRLQRQMDSRIRYLKPTDPLSISPAQWDCAAGWTITAYCNVCFSAGHVNLKEMYRLRDDLNRKLEGKTDAGTLVWIWDRLAQTGPHGESYVRRFRPAFLECFGTQIPSTIPTSLQP